MTPDTPTALFCTAQDREEALCDELRRNSATPSNVAPGWVVCANFAIQPPLVAFAAQMLPNPRHLTGHSVNDWVKRLAPWVCDTLANSGDTPWRLHLFAHPDDPNQPKPARLALIGEGITAYLRKKQRRLLRCLVSPNEPWQAYEWLLQVAFSSRDEAFVSAASGDQCRAFRPLISRFPGGVAPVVEDRTPPSRAYLKLLEAQAHLGHTCQPGETCSDLGAAPGSWSYIALAQGAHVTAIDRSPLDAALMTHPQLTWQKGDAFKFVPQAPVDWLLCDVIAYPERSIELLQTWLRAKLCKKFIVTLKFRGDADYPKVDDCKKVLAQSATDFGLRAMRHNKNEVCAYGRLRT